MGGGEVETIYVHRSAAAPIGCWNGPTNLLKRTIKQCNTKHTFFPDQGTEGVRYYALGSDLTYNIEEETHIPKLHNKQLLAIL